MGKKILPDLDTQKSYHDKRQRAYVDFALIVKKDLPVDTVSRSREATNSLQ